jgi:hypothetical protein
MQFCDTYTRSDYSDVKHLKHVVSCEYVDLMLKKFRERYH